MDTTLEPATSFFKELIEYPDARPKEVFDATHSAVVKEFKVDPAHFEGMQDKTVDAAFIAGALIVYVLWFALMAAIAVGLISLVAFLGGPAWLIYTCAVLPSILTIAFALQIIDHIVFPGGVYFAIGYAWIHRKVKAYFADKK